MGKWSELRAVSMFQVILLAIVDVAAEMSGEVGCCSVCGNLVWVLVFSSVCGEFCIRSEMRFPLWSFRGEYHVVECAFTSPIVMEFPSVSMWAKVLVISASSVAWSGSVVSLGGMYILIRCSVLFCDKCTLVICSSVFLVFR